MIERPQSREFGNDVSEIAAAEENVYKLDRITVFMTTGNETGPSVRRVGDCAARRLFLPDDVTR